VRTARRIARARHHEFVWGREAIRRTDAIVHADDFDRFGAEDAGARLAARLDAVAPQRVHFAPSGAALLSPPLQIPRDRFDGPGTAISSLLVFAAHGTPASRPLGEVLAQARERHLVAWRHYPDPATHPRAPILALAAEAAALGGKFWTLTRELLRLRHDDPVDLHTALLRAGLDPERTLATMRSGAGADRVVEDSASARASGVEYSPTLFINGKRYDGSLDPAAVMAALAPG
jgi:Thioredoxin